MSVGAELSTLSALNTTFKNNADAAIDIKTQVSNGVDSSVWTGKYSDEFREAWTTYSKNLDTLNEALLKAAEDVRTNHNNIAAATGEPDRL
ncbi:hypothetical protein GCM10022261_07620 [Brevibacterium daeguense]|uniref:WXG100 family type VII secretion target n=1 Tax=Brevibacterium daeguense TaxID=909936 RepID=A0ABP8EH89_9MICO|nr:hypothetical protein [Brevibacterium daeguense]